MSERLDAGGGRPYRHEAQPPEPDAPGDFTERAAIGRHLCRSWIGRFISCQIGMTFWTSISILKTTTFPIVNDLHDTNSTASA